MPAGAPDCCAPYGLFMVCVYRCFYFRAPIDERARANAAADDNLKRQPDWNRWPSGWMSEFALARAMAIAIAV